MKHLTIIVTLLISVTLTLTGCGQRRPATVPVSGEVLYQGEPLKQGTIIFEPAGSRPATGKIVDGKIVDVTSYEPNDGVAPGTAKIAVFSLGEEKGYMGTETPSLIPVKYNNPATSGLTAVIEEGKPLRLVLDDSKTE